jgi:hypothetical protein
LDVAEDQWYKLIIVDYLNEYKIFSHSIFNFFNEKKHPIAIPFHDSGIVLAQL